MMTSYCKVAFCRYSDTHVTKGHKCGRCGIYGHGDAECRGQRNIRLLDNYLQEILPIEKQCLINDCLYKELHTIDAHHCPKCNKREKHPLSECGKKSDNLNTIFNIKCPLCRTDNILNNPKKIKGLTDKCSICIDNNVEILFPECYHCCVCYDCLIKLN